MRNSYYRSNRSYRPQRNFRQQIRGGRMSNDELMRAIQASKKIIQPTDNQPENNPVALKKFTDFILSNILQNNIAHKGYAVTTPIQDQTISHIMEGKDVIGIANTGTGKTAAFLIPLIEKVIKNNSEKILIIGPTRELALQIRKELMDLTRGMNIYSVLCIGGSNLRRQKDNLRRNPHFVIGTPGRMKDLTHGVGLNMRQFHTVVLDEADRMVDIGFIDDIKYFISLLPKDRQSLFFSATISVKEKEILKNFVVNPVTISVKQKEAAENIHQDIVRVQNKFKKIEQLHDLLIQKEFDKVLIFGRTKWGVQKLTEELIDRGFKAAVIHGNKSQHQRQMALERFKNNEVNILLATDVASRGLDIPNISHVINYDMPASTEDYIHRIGRTGRVDKKGIALTFVE